MLEGPPIRSKKESELKGSFVPPCNWTKFEFWLQSVYKINARPVASSALPYILHCFAKPIAVSTIELDSFQLNKPNLSFNSQSNQNLQDRIFYFYKITVFRCAVFTSILIKNRVLMMSSPIPLPFHHFSMIFRSILVARPYELAQMNFVHNFTSLKRKFLVVATGAGNLLLLRHCRQPIKIKVAVAGCCC